MRSPRIFVTTLIAGLSVAACGDAGDPIQADLASCEGGNTGGAPAGECAQPPAPSFASVGSPDAAYTSATTLIDISSIAQSTNVGSISDGSMTVTFSSSMNKRKVPFSWATWSSPPFSETATPHVLSSNGASSVTLDLSQPAIIFGFEIEPNPFTLESFTADFVDTGSGTTVETVAVQAHGSSGARLLAASLASPADRVIITGTSDFAIAQVRYLSQITVDVAIAPETINLKSARGGANLNATIFTDGDFDAADVDVSSLSLGSTPILTKPNGQPKGALEDADGDGDLDLVAHFHRGDLVANGDLDASTTELCVSGATTGGVPIAGCGAVVVK